MSLIHSPPSNSAAGRAFDRYAPDSDRDYCGAANAATCHVWTAPAVQGKNRAFQRSVRVQPCIRPLNAAVVAAGPDVIR